MEQITIGLLVIITVMSTLTFGISVLPKIRKRNYRKSVILDSCALIDGRIREIIQAGFMPERIIIPQFVIKELQLLADGSDAHKRERARYGLDIAQELRSLTSAVVMIDKKDFSSLSLVDDKLVALAEGYGARLYTTDYNLSKVAAVKGVEALNVNELAQRLKPTVLPGETLNVKIIQRGSSRGQGVGYSEEGTMVVVENASSLMGKHVEVEVDRAINTLAGRMIFARRTTKKQPKRKQEQDIYVRDLRKELR